MAIYHRRTPFAVFLEDVFSPENQLLKVGETFKVSQYAQTNEFDIRATTLSILYAKLELQFGLFRAITPQYSKYSWEEIDAHRLSTDRSAIGIAIKQNAVKAKKYVNLDILETCRAAGVLRADVLRKLNEWNDGNIIELKTSGVEHVYRVLRKLPSTTAETEDILDKLYRQIQDRERQDLLRTQAVVNLATESSCLSFRIGEYFGDKNTSLAQRGCGHCTWCETKKRVAMPTRQPVQTSNAQIEEILDATDVRDDPRFLARVAFGITSPRVSKLKLSSHHVFGSLNTHDFLGLVRLFTKVCDNAPEELKSSQGASSQGKKTPSATKNLGATRAHSSSSREGASSTSYRGASTSYRGRGSGRGGRGASRYRPYSR